ncbi:MAG: class I SAM-dependent methyltransferase [Planctomycetota bacterium]
MTDALALELGPARRYKTSMPKPTKSKNTARAKSVSGARTGRSRKKPSKKKPPFTARTADKHVLYELAVQSPLREVKFLSRYYQKTTGEDLSTLREDFCGTALMATWFVKHRPQNRAIGVDLDRATLDWGIAHNVDKLLDDAQKQRLTLLCNDVRAVTKPKAQAIAALNFSYSVFKKRSDLLDYLRACYDGLEPGGMMFLDAWGGPDVQAVKTDRTRHKGFDYLWEQQEFDPISHHILCAISFAFRDGTRMRNAFVYDWRLWNMPELRELMEEAGFEDVHILWEGTLGDTRAGNGVFRRKEVGDADSAWIVYVVGRKPLAKKAAAPRARTRTAKRS